MKPRKITLISIALLATLLLGAGAVLMLTAPQNVNAQVRWDPRSIVDTAPVWWKAEIKVSGQYEILPDSILLEGQLEPHRTREERGRLIATFKGNRVLSIITQKIGHMGIIPEGKHRVDLEITGLVEGEDAPIPFSGTGRVFVIITNPSPP